MSFLSCFWRVGSDASVTFNSEVLAGCIIRIANSNATTPSLFGIDRWMAYSYRKYDSGWMWLRVFSGFASTDLNLIIYKIYMFPLSC